MSNHSCCPNAAVVLVGHTLFIRANQAIKEGSEVCISYFDVLRPVAERERLTRGWGFRCACPRCDAERELLPQSLQQPGCEAEEVEQWLNSPESHISATSREAQWLRASHTLAYRSRLEALFPLSADAMHQRAQMLRAMEATDPASFTHVKFSYMDWLANESIGHREEKQKAIQYCDLVHSSRYGRVPKQWLVPLVKQTEVAIGDSGVGVEFCNAWQRPRIERPTPAAPVAASSHNICNDHQTGASVILLD